MNRIVFDIETQNTFTEVGSREPTALNISLVAVYDYASGQYLSFVESELNKLWPMLERADLLIGYNSDYFDIPILNKYYNGDLTKIKSLDLLNEIKLQSGKRLKLDDVAAATLGRGKSGHGLEAVLWWKQGEIEKIRDYCIEDVRITKEIYEYAAANKSLKYRMVNEIRDIPLDLTKYEGIEASAINYTLPF